MPTHDWLEAASRQFQVFAGELMYIVDVADLDRVVHRMLCRLRGPASRLDNVLLAMLSGLAILNIVDHFHPPALPKTCPCRALSANALKALLTMNNLDARKTLRDWSDEFRDVYSTHHTLCLACVAARMIRADPKRRWRVDDLRPRSWINCAQLTREFRSEFGLTTREYIEVVRLWHALPMLFAGLKIEAIAMEVGYGSKKNFYQTFEKWLHMTPKTARLLDHTRRELLKQSLARLVLKVCTASAEARVRLMRSA